MGTADSVTKRAFRRSSELLIDVYGVDAGGPPVSFSIPVEAMRDLRWGNRVRVMPPMPAARGVAARSTRLRRRLRSAEVTELSGADFVEARTLGDPELARLIASRFAELRSAWERSDCATLACASGVLLALDATQLPAARLLVRLLGDERRSAFEQTCIHGSVGEAFQPGRQTEAMAALAAALRRLLRAPKAHRWGPSAYSCAGHLHRFDPRKTVLLCKRELSQRDEGARSRLVSELAAIPGADVLLLLKSHFPREVSPRLKVRLLHILGKLLPARARVECLRAALDDESPWSRYLALKALRRVPSERAVELARNAIDVEVDPYLRMLLEQAIRFFRSPR